MVDQFVTADEPADYDDRVAPFLRHRPGAVRLAAFQAEAMPAIVLAAIETQVREGRIWL